MVVCLVVALRGCGNRTVCDVMGGYLCGRGIVQVGDRVKLGGHLGVVRFVGPVEVRSALLPHPLSNTPSSRPSCCGCSSLFGVVCSCVRIVLFLVVVCPSTCSLARAHG